MEFEQYFKDRQDAGEKLTKLLIKFKGKNGVILALPRGGVIVGQEIANKLNCPLSVLIVKKIGHPQNPEYAIGAVSESGQKVLNEDEIKNLDKSWLKNKIAQKIKEARTRKNLCLGKKSSEDLKGKIAIIIDDGLATGLTMLVAIKELKTKKPDKIIVAVPVAPNDTAIKIKKEVDEFISVFIPVDFAGAIGAYYQNFDQVSDEQVQQILAQY